MLYVIIINLFFVPTLPLYLSNKSRKQPLKPSLELLFQYCIAACLNYVATHVVTLFILKLTGIAFPLDSARYTLAALLSAWLLFLAQVVIKYLRPEVNISKVEERKNDEKDEVP